MAHNETHPLFRKDDDLVNEFNDWFFHASAKVTAEQKKREILETLDRTNAIARDTTTKTIAELDQLDEAHGIKPEGPPPHAPEFKQSPANLSAYQKSRAEIFTRFSGINDRLWKQRETLGGELDRTIDKQEAASLRPRTRMPARIIQAARISATQHQAASSSAYDQLVNRPSPQSPSTAFSRDRPQERE